MILIYKKTENEINAEIAKRSKLQSFAKITAKEICPTYLITVDGRTVDTKNLSDQEVTDLFDEDLFDFFNIDGTYKSGRPVHNKVDNLENLIVVGRHIPDSFILADLLADRRFSYDTLIDLMHLRKQYGEMGANLTDTLRDTARIIKYAKDAINFGQEFKDGSKPVEEEEIIYIIEQLKLIRDRKVKQSNLVKI